MTGESADGTACSQALDRKTERALAALLAIDAEAAAEVRRRSPSRRRPIRQYGPQLDLGDEPDRP